MPVSQFKKQTGQYRHWSSLYLGQGTSLQGLQRSFWFNNNIQETSKDNSLIRRCSLKDPGCKLCKPQQPLYSPTSHAPPDRSCPAPHTPHSTANQDERGALPIALLPHTYLLHLRENQNTLCLVLLPTKFRQIQKKVSTELSTLHIF